MIRKKIVYSNGPSQVHVSFPVNDDSNRTAYKTCLKFSMKTHKKRRLAKEGVVANIVEGQ